MDDFYYIGQIELYPYTFAPAGWLYCDGRTLQIQSYSPLFALIGNRYGGDGRTTFAIPNMKGTEPIPNTHYCIATDGVWPNRP